MTTGLTVTKGLALLATALVTGCVTINLLPGPGPLKEVELSGSGSAKVLMLELSGLISALEEDGFIERPSPVARIKEEPTRAQDDDRIKAVRRP